MQDKNGIHLLILRPKVIYMQNSICKDLKLYNYTGFQELTPKTGGRSNYYTNPTLYYLYCKIRRPQNPWAWSNILNRMDPILPDCGESRASSSKWLVSSIDLHTQFSYQRTLPESFAIMGSIKYKQCAAWIGIRFFI